MVSLLCFKRLKEVAKEKVIIGVLILIEIKSMWHQIPIQEIQTIGSSDTFEDDKYKFGLKWALGQGDNAQFSLPNSKIANKHPKYSTDGESTYPPSFSSRVSSSKEREKGT